MATEEKQIKNEQKQELVGIFCLYRKVNEMVNPGVFYLKRTNDDDIEPNKLTIPGGHIEKEEKPIDAIKREFKEETGLDLNTRIIEFQSFNSFVLASVNNGQVAKIEVNIYPFMTIIDNLEINKIVNEDGVHYVLINQNEFKNEFGDIENNEKKLKEKYTTADVDALKLYYKNISTELEKISVENGSKIEVSLIH
ncbi:MAG: NUDIX hydrolase [Candidatus Marsarchaeota archaeon]|jgi:ADP-ribose pyrophosphatase|nr:NUDIX hydrolase [Candidatus Marsarchaeota archaeon]